MNEEAETKQQFGEKSFGQHQQGLDIHVRWQDVIRSRRTENTREAAFPLKQLFVRL